MRPAKIATLRQVATKRSSSDMFPEAEAGRVTRQRSGNLPSPRSPRSPKRIGAGLVAASPRSKLRAAFPRDDSSDGKGSTAGSEESRMSAFTAAVAAATISVPPVGPPPSLPPRDLPVTTPSTTRRMSAVGASASVAAPAVSAAAAAAAAAAVTGSPSSPSESFRDRSASVDSLSSASSMTVGARRSRGMSSGGVRPMGLSFRRTVVEPMAATIDQEVRFVIESRKRISGSAAAESLVATAASSLPSAVSLPAVPEPHEARLEVFLGKTHLPPDRKDVFKPRYFKLAADGSLAVHKIVKESLTQGWFSLGAVKVSAPPKSFSRSAVLMVHGSPTLAVYPEVLGDAIPTLYIRGPAAVVAEWASLLAPRSGHELAGGNLGAAIHAAAAAPLHARHCKWLLKVSSKTLAQRITLTTQRIYRDHAADWICLHDLSGGGGSLSLGIVAELAEYSARLSALVANLKRHFPDSAGQIVHKLVSVARHLHELGNAMASRQLAFAVDDSFHFGQGFGGRVDHDPLWESIDRKTQSAMMSLYWMAFDAEAFLPALDAPVPSIIPIHCIGRALDLVDAHFMGSETSWDRVPAQNLPHHAAKVQALLEKVGHGLVYADDPAGSLESAVWDDMLSRCPPASLAESRANAKHRSQTFALTRKTSD
jgi:hypothetical protein